MVKAKSFLIISNFSSFDRRLAFRLYFEFDLFGLETSEGRLSL